MGFSSLKCCLLVASAILGAICLLLGIAAMIFIPKIVNESVYQRTHLGQDANGTDNLMLKMFRDPPYDIRLQIWTVSVQNSDAVVKSGAKPAISEKGPYTFNVHLHKTNVTFGVNRTRLSFRNNRTYFFNPNQSCADCRLTDRVTVPNILFQKIVDIAQQHSILAKWFIEPFIKGKEKVFIDVSVDELLFKGYRDEIISALCDHKFVRNFCNLLKIPERIGLFYGQNGTDDGIYEVDTGIRDPNQLDRVYAFDGMEGKLSDKYWYNESARMINGTDAELFRPNLFKGESLQVFIGQLCRSFNLDVRGPATTSGIPVFRYAQPDSTLQVDEQRSQGFCNPASPDFYHNSSIQEAHCAPSGLLDMTSCLPGSPRIFFSGSHFRNTPEGMRHSFEGTFASPSDDDISFFDIEPITGVVVGVQQRYQLNLGMLRGNLMITAKMRDMIVPMVWMNESAAIDQNTRNQLLVPVDIMWGTFTGGLVLISIGAVFLVCFAGIFVGFKIVERSRLANQQGEQQYLIPAPSAAAADDDPFSAPPAAETEPMPGPGPNQQQQQQQT